MRTDDRDPSDPPRSEPGAVRSVLVIAVDDLDVGAVRAIQYASRLNMDSTYVVHAAPNDDRGLQVADRWAELGLDRLGLRLQVVQCPSWNRIDALAGVIRGHAAQPRTEVTVLVAHTFAGRNGTSAGRRTTAVLVKAEVAGAANIHVEELVLRDAVDSSHTSPDVGSGGRA